MKARKLRFKAIFIALILCIVTSTINFPKANAALYSNLPVSYIDDKFPDSYMPYINALKEKHPNWVFKAVHTGLDWNTALSHETYEVNDGISLVEDIFGNEWKKDGQNHYQDGNYVTASKQGVAYVMDPRNFINESGIFQFEALRFVEGVQTVEAVQGVLATTPMGGKYATKVKYRGTWYDMDESYADKIYRYSKEVGINPVHIASRIRQENSGNIVNNPLINGDYGVYNFFNIGAYDTASAGAIANGAKYAQNAGWTTIDLGIKGGADYIFSKYIKWGQNTIYFERFDVNNPGTAQWLLGTGYMTNIFAPKSEAQITYNAYASNGLLDSAFEFDIPVYENMPKNACAMPTQVEITFTPDNTKVYLDDPSDSGVTDTFPIRTGPDMMSSLLMNLVETKDGQENRTKFTRIGIGQNTLYDKIQFEDGRIGYVLKKWIYEYKYTKVTEVALDTTFANMNVGDTLTLKATVKPINAQDKNVTWSTSDGNVATVDQNGKVTAKATGVATITVTTKDQGKTAICTVNVVNNKVSSITVSNNSYNINVGQSMVITPTILPATAANKNYTIITGNNNIAKVEGKAIVGVSKGTTNATFTTEEGQKSITITIIVNEKIDNTPAEVSKPTFDSTLNVSEENVISNIEPGTTLGQVVEKIETNATITATNVSGRELANTDVVGTATTLNVGEDKYEIIVYGDVDGSGIINSRDLLMLQRYILGKYDLQNIQVKAGIIDKVSSAPKAADLLKIQRFILGRYTIEQW